LSRKTAIELICSLALGAAMVWIEVHSGPESVLGIIGAFGLLLVILVSMNLQQNPVMIATMVVYWAAIGWVCYRGVRLFVAIVRESKSGDA